jgi:phage tail sheath protein FI
MGSNALLSSKIAIVEEEPRVRSIQAAPTAVAGAVGVTERGPFGATRINSWEEYIKIFGGYVAASDLPLAVEGFFANGGQEVWISRTVHYTDVANANSKTSAVAYVVIPTDSLSAVAAYTQGSVEGPWELTPADTLLVAISDGSGVMQSALTATFSATAAARESAVPGAMADGEQLTVKIDRGSVQTITFDTLEFVDISTPEPAEIMAVINAQITGARATVTSSGTKVTITSDRKGLTSYVEVTGGTANVGLAFNTAEVAGTGNVDDILAVTFIEFKTIVEAAISNVVVTSETGLPRITRVATGADSKVQVAAGSTTEQIFGFDTAIHIGTDSGTLDTLRFEGKTDGAYANGIRPKIEAATNGVAGDFNLVILSNGIIIETFPNVSMDDDAENYVVDVVNASQGGSNLVTAIDLDAATEAPDDRPANGTYTMASGSDGLTSLADTDFIGSSAGHTGIRAFDTIETLRTLVIPGKATSAIHNAMATYAEITRRGTLFAILACPSGLDASGMVDYVKNQALLKELTEFAAIHWPRVTIVNPNKSIYGSADTLTIEASGHIAGLFARNDNAKPGGVYEAPAGIEFGRLVGVVGLETDEVKDETKRDIVFPELINPIVAYPGTQVHVDGARTLKSTGPFPTIGERRGVIFIETSIQNGLLFAKHRKIKASLLSQLDRSVRAFLLVQLRNGAFASDDPKKAFFVDFSIALNPPSEGFVRRVNGRIGLATAKPAEFIVLRFSQDQRALEEELAQAA